MRMDKLSAKKRDGGCLQKSCELMDSRLLEHRQSGKSLSLMAKPLIDAPQAFPLRGRWSSKARPDEVENFESDTQSQSKKKRAEAAPRDDKRQKVIGRFIFDFYCASAKLVIELDGSQHYESEGAASDRERDRALEQLGITVVRYSNDDVNRNFDGACADLLRRLALPGVGDA